ncbi:hypothetical protein [Tenacibaculum maritimum]|uniref:hypothetical protein n=1 Tax=Tenacibaculum maritimum TaxID=107401 RepID=UPI003876698B
MAVLRLKQILYRKIKGASLTEVLIASSLILLVFGIAIATLNNVLQASVAKRKERIEATLYELQYLYKNKKIKLPFYDERGEWDIRIEKEEDIILFEAINRSIKKEITKKIIAFEVQ